ncbi:MAG TPA: methyltransferase domain-containing protein [Blastocatellia bacterium]|nr:methyltransferase domain-containing protein [Blastocatellia bacterium]
MSREKELAYRYDLFITPDWRDRFDQIVDENIELPVEARILDVNCGTGAHAIAIGDRLKNGEVLAIDPDQERINIARAKAEIAKVKRVNFECGDTFALPYATGEFDAVIGDGSLLAADQIEHLLIEMVRVARPGARIVLKIASHGSLDEFFSVYWEALHECGIDDAVWDKLRSLIEERRTISQAEDLGARAGLRDVQAFSKKEEFLFESGSDFLSSPLIEDIFLNGWFEIVPEHQRQEVRSRITAIIDRDRHGAPFDVSVKATVVSGVK